MPIRRKFLDWSQPALPAVADYLMAEYAGPTGIDLGEVIVVVPGGRAGRRLLEILVERAEQRSLPLVPPRIETIGHLPENFYAPKVPFASDLVQKLAWAQALRQLDRDRVKQVVPELPAEDDFTGWMALGELLWQQHRELAADGLDFADVARLGSELENFDETERWQVLRTVQTEYLGILDELSLWDVQTARLFAIEHGECRTDKAIVLVGTVDMSRAMRQMLDGVAGQVTALILAPSAWADRFDEHGCLDPDAWQDVPIALRRQQVRLVDGPAEQAQAVVDTIAETDGRYRADEITIGMADESLVAMLRRYLAHSGLASRWVADQMLPDSAPCRLLAAVADFLDGQRYEEFAALVRHPDVDCWLERRGIGGDWLTELDNYHSEHLQLRLGEWLGPTQTHERVRRAWQEVLGLLEPLQSQPRKLNDWTAPLLDLVGAVYEQVVLDLEDAADHATEQACRAIAEVLGEHTQIPDALAPVVSGSRAIRLTIEQLAHRLIAPPVDESALELLGWLELPLDDAPVLMVTTFNEGHVPKSQNSDLFLPNELRRRLGVVDNCRRYARDAYALSVLTASRAELTLIVARRDSRGDPLTPSRLLFATDPTDIAHRVIDFYEGALTPVDVTHIVEERLRAPVPVGFSIPQPEPLSKPIESVSVTAFRDYLACPYRFYLRHVHHLRQLDDATRELDALLFGNLVHEVFFRFGKSEVRASTDAQEIRRFLHQTLHKCTQASFGSHRTAPVNVQVMQLSRRLDAFANWQADWAGRGWTIEHVEVALKGDDLRLQVAERSIAVRGRIDRIDRHAGRNEWIIFDYKSGDAGTSPMETHQRRGEWVDLQLPLYRRGARSLGVHGDVRLGYILLPKDTTRVGHELATWTEEELQQADEVAHEVARRILDGEFWPPAELTSGVGFAEYAAICQDGVFDRKLGSRS